jgi:hypothetical protein
MRKLFAAVTVLGLVTAAAVAADKEGIKKED